MVKLRCEFIASASSVKSIPSSQIPELAFSGRSNVGKSSLINSLCFSKKVARTSSKPGCTRRINFFSVNCGDALRLVDLPGYGYSLAGKDKIYNYLQLISFYLTNRVNLRRIFLLIDSRRGIGELDMDFMNWMEVHSLPYQIVVTKTDKLGVDLLKQTLTKIESRLVGLESIFYPLICVSNRTRDGLGELINEIAKFAKR